MTLDEIKARIEENIETSHVHVRDLGGGDHIQAIVVSAKFQGLPMIKAHRLVLDLFKSEIASNEVHALTLKTYTPEQYDKL